MMGKKFAVIAGICVIIAAAVGVVGVTANRSAKKELSPTGETYSSDEVSDAKDEEYTGDPDIDGFENVDDQTLDNEDLNHEETEIEDASVSDDEYIADDADPVVADEIISTVFTVKRIVDTATDEEYAPRVVFGASYTDCYVSFDTAGNFELLLDPSNADFQRGAFLINADTIDVSYEGDRSSSYSIIKDADGNLEYIIVPYGEYSVYFGA